MTLPPPQVLEGKNENSAVQGVQLTKDTQLLASHMYSLLSNGQYKQLCKDLEQFVTHESPTTSLEVVRLLYGWLFQHHPPQSEESTTEMLVLWYHLYELLLNSGKFKSIPLCISPLKRLVTANDRIISCLKVILNKKLLTSDQLSKLTTWLLQSTLSLESGISTQIWNFKRANRLTMCKEDLTHIMRYYENQKEWLKLVNIYHSIPGLHDNNSQIFLLLKVYCKKHVSVPNLDTKIIELFNALQFDKRTDTNFQVLRSAKLLADLLKIGKPRLIYRFYHMFLRTGLTPNSEMLHIIFYLSFVNNKYIDCFQKFDHFETHNVKPLKKTYQQMLQVYQELTNIDGALKLLKQMTSANPEYIDELTFQPILHICRKTNNFDIAEQIVSVMVDQYKIPLTTVTVSSLMSIAISCEKYDTAVKYFEKYNEPLGEKRILYAKLLLCYIAQGERVKAKKLIKMTRHLGIYRGPKFNELYLKYLTNVLNNVDDAQILLEKLHDRGTAISNHFKIVMQAYHKQRRYDDIIKLYDQLIDPTRKKVVMESKILYYYLDAVYNKCHCNDRLIKPFVENMKTLIDEISMGKIKLKKNAQFHSSVVTHSVLSLARDGYLHCAQDLINFYEIKFRDIDDKTFKLQDRLSYWRARCILYSLQKQWDKFDKLFDFISNKIKTYDDREFKLRTGRYENSNDVELDEDDDTMYKSNKIGDIQPKLDSIFIGILKPKLKRLQKTKKFKQCYKLITYLYSNKFNIDRESWELAVNILLDHHATVEDGFYIIEQKLVWGYVKMERKKYYDSGKGNLGEKAKRRYDNKVKYDPRLHKDGTPKLYISNATMCKAVFKLHRMLNDPTKESGEIARLKSRYPKLEKQMRVMMDNRVVFNEMLTKAMWTKYTTGQHRLAQRTMKKK